MKPVIIAMGSTSDLEIMQDAKLALTQFEIDHELRILSAHRTPEEVSRFAQTAHANGVRVIIAGAGGAAHLPGMIASLTPLPVIGVPVPGGYMRGEDALWSIVQMPKGIPVATVAIGNAFNAGLLAVQILAQSDTRLLQGLLQYKQQLRDKVIAEDNAL